MEKAVIFKELNIGFLIYQRVKDMEIDEVRILNFFKCSKKEAEKMYSSRSIDSEILLKWSKLLNYDFFRIYTQHLILYSPPIPSNKDKINNTETSILPTFRKNIYTKQVIDFILKLIEDGDKTKKEVIEEYRIPKTTLYKWINKYKK
ncbi:transposase [Chryseobacterium tructae]|uniref:Transposase n=1 Tax=Chryseobacterium tructae TaxID=1037380 RepID=A0ABV7XYG6_9FLAO|nr:transposase [Chryseobacterium tructae]MDN3692512.1 transposase [Chryseobacterium tructae]